MRTRFALLIPAVAVASALTACGDSGPSKADFTARADSSCAAGNTAISTTAKPGNAAQVATAAGAAVSTVDGQVGTLRAMKAPGGGDKATVQGFITLWPTSAPRPRPCCRDAYRKLDAVAQPGNSLSSLGRYLDALLVVSNKLATDLKALPAPPGDEGTVGEFNAAMDTLNNKFKETSVAAKANNARLVVGLSDELDVATTALNAKLDAYGLKTCGTSGV